MKHAILITLLAFSVCFICIAQDSQLKELRFNHLFVEDGLPERSIRALIQDKQGYIWTGTQNGLVRYDGYKTKVYKFGSNNVYHIFIHSIFEDRKGELWVGTFGVGFYYYDRANDSFILFKPGLENGSSLNSGGISSLNDDQYGNIWMVEQNEDKHTVCIHSFDPKTKTFKHYSNEEKGSHYIKAPTTTFYDFLEDTGGRLWLGSDNGLYEYDRKEDKFIPHFTSEDYSQRKDFPRLQQDASNPDILWIDEWNNISHKDELWRYNTKDNSVKKFIHNPKDPGSLGGDTIGVMHKDAKGRIWVGTNNGLSVFDPATEHFINYSPQDGKKNLSANAIQEIKEDKNGNFWCASGYGLVFFESKEGKFIRYTAKDKNTDINALANNDMHHLLIDHAGTLWFGSSYTGLQWINKGLSKCILYKNSPGQTHYFPGGSASSFGEAPDSTFYIGTDHELYHWQPKTDSFKQIKLSKYKDKDMSVGSVIVDRQGLIWCGGFITRDNQGAGLFCYDPVTGKTKQFIHNEKDSTSLSNNTVSYILEDHSGILWIGTWGGGLCRFNKTSQTFTRYPYIVNKFNTPNNSALDDAQVTKIYEDKNDVIWVGTNIGALNELNRQSGRFTSYQNQLPGFFSVIDIFEDAKGELWTGTYLSGIFHFDRKTKKLTMISEKDGLLHNRSNDILEDNKDNLWIVSARGISILNPATNKISTLTKNNVLPGEQFSEHTNSAIKTKKGSFLIACKNGFISLNPDDFAPDTNTPDVHIETIDFTNPQTANKKEKDSSVYAYGKSRIELHYNQNKISFHYIGLQYQNAELTQYAYKLDGYDKDWIQAGTQRTVTYTNLFPGAYTFHVKAANSDEVWSTKEDTITIIISPPWWKTWWAYLLYAVAFALAVWSFIAYRSRNLKRENKRLEEKVSIRTNELKKEKEKVESTLTELKSTQAQLIQSEKMASLGELTAGIAHEIQNPLNFVNNFSDINKELIDEMQQEMHKGNLDDAKTISNDIKENEEKINHHGKRADAIVKGMLQHSKANTGTKELTDINKLADEYLRLSYHGFRAKDKSVNAVPMEMGIKTDFDESIGKINIVPQDIGRVLLNLYNNAFYAISERKKQAVENYEPIVSVKTKNENGKILISVRDNGNGIPQNIIDKIFQPFFTTKPTGQGTGLGLSLAYDIIKAHGGEIKVESEEEEGSEFVIQLPYKEIV